jgi:hypothetical protein
MSKPLLLQPISKLEANRWLGLGGWPIQPRWRLVRKVNVGGLSRGGPVPIDSLI